MTQPLEIAIPAARHMLRLHADPAPKPSIIRFMAALDAAVALTNRDGRVTKMNGPARDCFIGPSGADLRGSIETAVRVAMSDRHKLSDVSPNPARYFEIGTERFHATIVLAGNDIMSQDIGAMVVLRREGTEDGPQVTEHSLAERFGLTPQESRVAVMLADQRSNREIADRLGVSVHTARHHTERVLAKLQIHSRYDVKRVTG